MYLFLYNRSFDAQHETIECAVVFSSINASFSPFNLYSSEWLDAIDTAKEYLSLLVSAYTFPQKIQDLVGGFPDEIPQGVALEKYELFHNAYLSDPSDYPPFITPYRYVYREGSFYPFILPAVNVEGISVEGGVLFVIMLTYDGEDVEIEEYNPPNNLDILNVPGSTYKMAVYPYVSEFYGQSGEKRIASRRYTYNPLGFENCYIKTNFLFCFEYGELPGDSIYMPHDNGSFSCLNNEWLVNSWKIGGDSLHSWEYGLVDIKDYCHTHYIGAADYDYVVDINGFWFVRPQYRPLIISGGDGKFRKKKKTEVIEAVSGFTILNNFIEVIKWQLFL